MFSKNMLAKIDQGARAVLETGQPSEYFVGPNSEVRVTLSLAHGASAVPVQESAPAAAAQVEADKNAEVASDIAKNDAAAASSSTPPAPTAAELKAKAKAEKEAAKAAKAAAKKGGAK